MSGLGPTMSISKLSLEWELHQEEDMLESELDFEDDLNELNELYGGVANGFRYDDYD